MKKAQAAFELSATDLVGYLNCHHLTALDRAVAEGALPKPKVWDPLLQILWERGAAHERSYVEHLMKAGLGVVRIDGVEVTSAAVADTLTTMRRGVPIIVQAALTHQGWNGRADILRRIEVPSALGAWSYEPIDTKLARETKAGTILQLCFKGSGPIGGSGLYFLPVAHDGNQNCSPEEALAVSNLVRAILAGKATWVVSIRRRPQVGRIC